MGSAAPGGDRWEVRGYAAEDEAALRRVCLLTGDAGGDATGLYADDDLLADIFLLPYLAFEPELASVLTRDGRPVGYLVATADSVGFAERYRRDWLPGFALRHPRPARIVSFEDRILDLGHSPEHSIGDDHVLFPAHLHIDLLPEAQGRGWGRLLVRRLLAALRSAGVPGVQLGVGERNVGARAFYRRLGFAPLPSAPQNALRLGLPTDAVV
ncbi:GNAT family N-acetyltransferase [Leifsonia sp. NPDC080035]|uniref:GNAT family N-acetyltransferase n=1 Tax=Leifsonia sp. NPDC080035 TaxID=3143936 RepID=A0AAU7G6H0_9MICO